MPDIDDAAELSAGASARAELIEQLATEARDTMAVLDGVLTGTCPGGKDHGFVQHRDGRQPWCPYCRYTEWGVKV